MYKRQACNCRSTLSKPPTAAAADIGCHGNVTSSSSSADSVSQMSSQVIHTGVDVSQTSSTTTSRGAGHSRHKHLMTSQPGYMQMTRAATVRSALLPLICCCYCCCDICNASLLRLVVSCAQNTNVMLLSYALGAITGQPGNGIIVCRV